MANNITGLLDYWMLNIIHDALQKEYDAFKKKSGISVTLKILAEDKGVEAAKLFEKGLASNKHTSLGRIGCAIAQIEKMREAVTLAVTDPVEDLKQPDQDHLFSEVVRIIADAYSGAEAREAFKKKFKLILK